jgi:hypothetical protein
MSRRHDTRWRVRLGVCCLAGLLTIAKPAIALAEPSPADVAAAQKLFDEAMSLMEAKRFAEACPRFEQSQKLDPGMGTQFRLAECLEAAGSIGSAWRLYDAVATEAERAGRTDRRSQATERRVALDRRVPWLKLRVSASVTALPGFAVKRDGQPVAATELGRLSAIDPGGHTLSVSATGKKSWQTTFRALEGGSVEIDVPALDNEPQPDSKRPLPPKGAENDDPGVGQKIAAIAVGGFGLASVGAGIGLGLLASSTWDDALAGCEGGSPTRCGPQAIADGDKATTLAIFSTVGFVVGGVAIAAAPILWLTAPSDTSPSVTALRFAPQPNGFGASIEGRF